MNDLKGNIVMINGPVILGENMTGFKMREMVLVGEKQLIGEIISIDGDMGTVQVYEETEGVKRGEIIRSTGKPLSLKLGPGMLGNMFDGIQRPLNIIKAQYGSFIPEGIGLISIDDKKLWDAKIIVEMGQYLTQGQVFGNVQETSLITNRLLVPVGINGKVINIKEEPMKISH